MFHQVDSSCIGLALAILETCAVHTPIYCFMLFHVSLPAITGADDLVLVAQRTPVRMAVWCWRVLGSDIDGKVTGGVNE
jgi:hypothetical protein